MSSIHRALNGDVLVHHLPKDEQTIDTALLAKHGRTARTLVKEGALRLTLLAIAPQGALPVHSADGPVSIQVLDGEAVFSAEGRDYTLGLNDVIVLAAGVDHAARSANGCRLLLTVVHPPSDAPPPPTT